MLNLATLLPNGEVRAVTLSALAERLNVSRREVEQAVLENRLAGLPVCSSSKGLWLTTSPQEAREQAQRLRSRAIHQMETAQAMERAADALLPVHQETLWDAAA